MYEAQKYDTFVRCLNGHLWKHSEQFRSGFCPLGTRCGGEYVSHDTSWPDRNLSGITAIEIEDYKCVTF